MGQKAFYSQSAELMHGALFARVGAVPVIRGHDALCIIPADMSANKINLG
jgi:hypothetical protein